MWIKITEAVYSAKLLNFDWNFVFMISGYIDPSAGAKLFLFWILFQYWSQDVLNISERQFKCKLVFYLLSQLV